MPESSIRTASRGGSVLGQIARAFLLPRKLDIDAEEGRVGAGSVGDRGSCRLLSGANGVALTTTVSPFRMRLHPRRLDRGRLSSAEGIAGPPAPPDRQIERRAAILIGDQVLVVEWQQVRISGHSGRAGRRRKPIRHVDDIPSKLAFDDRNARACVSCGQAGPQTKSERCRAVAPGNAVAPVQPARHHATARGIPERARRATHA